MKQNEWNRKNLIFIPWTAQYVQYVPSDKLNERERVINESISKYSWKFLKDFIVVVWVITLEGQR